MRRVPFRVVRSPAGARGMPTAQIRVVAETSTAITGDTPGDAYRFFNIAGDELTNGYRLTALRDHGLFLSAVEADIRLDGNDNNPCPVPQSLGFSVNIGGTEAYSLAEGTTDDTPAKLPEGIPTDVQRGSSFIVAAGTPSTAIWPSRRRYSWDPPLGDFPHEWIFQPSAPGLDIQWEYWISILAYQTNTSPTMDAAIQFFFLEFHREDFENGLAHAFIQGFTPPTYAEAPGPGTRQPYPVAPPPMVV